MIEKFNSFIKRKRLFDKKDKILAAVSGGVDSMVMLHLLLAEGYKNVEVLHCNFNLRGAESDNDENFVQYIALNLNIPFHVERFDTTGYADRMKISVQMAARELRYQWFNKMLDEKNACVIAIAHNSDDVIETFHINLIRGTGIRGLSGMEAKNGNLVRPVLCFSRKDIVDYANEMEISYRNDSSNDDTKYMRNKIRHEILPLFEEINPSYRQTMLKNIERLKAVQTIYENDIELKNKIFEDNNGRMVINIEDIEQLKPAHIYLYEFLNPYGFNEDSIQNILSGSNETGKKFYSNSHVLLYDRNRLLIEPIDKQKYINIEIDKNNIENKTIELSDDTGLIISAHVVNQQFDIPKISSVACVDFDKIEFPIKIRNWREGDFFYPLGMQSKKKLSDFFTDNKFSVFEKQEVMVFVSGNDNIFWIAGYRIDNRFRITDNTKTALIFELDKKI